MLLMQPKYYDGDYNKMMKILIGCKEIGCTFLVGGRNVDGAFKVVMHNKRAILIFLFIFSISMLMRSLCGATGSWRFECSRGTKRHVRLHSSRTVPHGYIFYRDKEKKWDVNIFMAEGQYIID